MSQYVSVGITDTNLWYQAPDSPSSESGPDPVALMNKLLDFIAKTGLDIDNAMNSPEVREFMQKANIKIAEVKAEEKERKQKSNLLLWGGVAAGAVFLAWRMNK